MESEENLAEPPQSAETPGWRDRFKLVLKVLIAPIPGIGIVLILNALNRGGWFALLSGVFGMLLYSALVFVQWLFDRSPGRQRPPHGPVREGPEARRAFLVLASRGFLINGPLGIAGFVGLFFLRGQSPVFALISAVLGLMLCIGLFRVVTMVGVLVLVHFAERIETQLAPPPDERGLEVDEGTP